MRKENDKIFFQNGESLNLKNEIKNHVVIVKYKT